MRTEWSPRIGWADLPARVRGGVEQLLGSAVVGATGQHGGFSPGSADRVRTSTGRRAFVKAVSSGLNEHSPDIHRKEAAIAAALPAQLPAPELIGTYDDGDWVALVFSDVEGRHPRTPWDSGELSLVLDALLHVAETPLHEDLDFLPRLEHELTEPFGGWTRLREKPPEDCDPWVLRNFPRLEELARDGLGALDGSSLVHTDVRADNILITADRGAVLVDWPWTCIGLSWMDALSVLLNVRVFDPDFDAGSVFESHRIFAPAAPGELDGVLAGLAAYFTDAARQAPPPGLPTLRDFQRRQGEAAVRWLRERTGLV